MTRGYVDYSNWNYYLGTYNYNFLTFGSQLLNASGPLNTGTTVYSKPGGAGIVCCGYVAGWGNFQLLPGNESSPNNIGIIFNFQSRILLACGGQQVCCIIADSVMTTSGVDPTKLFFFGTKEFFRFSLLSLAVL